MCKNSSKVVKLLYHRAAFTRPLAVNKNYTFRHLSFHQNSLVGGHSSAPNLLVSIPLDSEVAILVGVFEFIRNPDDYQRHGADRSCPKNVYIALYEGYDELQLCLYPNFILFFDFKAHHMNRSLQTVCS